MATAEKDGMVPEEDEAPQASDLEVRVEEGEGWERLLTITVSPRRVARTRAREREQLSKSVRLKGFRPGKVPDEVMEQRFGPAIDDRTIRRLVEDAYREAVRGEDLHPVGEPEIDSVDYREGESLSFRAAFEVVPEITLERTGGFRLERPAAEVDEEEVEELLGRVRDEQAVWEPVTRQPEEGDMVSVRIGPAGGEAADEAAEAGGAEAAEAVEPEGTKAGEPELRSYRFALGEGQAIPGVEEAIQTLSPGESGDFEVSFPEDFDDEEMAGASRRLHIELVDVKRKSLPALDDELARSVGDFESLEALRDAVREDLERNAEQEAEDTLRQQILDSIAEANPFEVPRAMVENYLDRVIEAPENADPERVQEARRQVYPSAEKQIRRQLVLDRLLEEGEYDATEEELEARIEELGERRGVDPRDLRRQLDRRSQTERLRRQIAVEKVFEALKSRSEIR